MHVIMHVIQSASTCMTPAMDHTKYLSEARCARLRAPGGAGTDRPRSADTLGRVLPVLSLYQPLAPVGGKDVLEGIVVPRMSRHWYVLIVGLISASQSLLTTCALSFPRNGRQQAVRAVDGGPAAGRESCYRGCEIPWPTASH
jgi:hypothetical protein